MSTVLSVNWPDFFAYLESAAIVTLMVLLIACVQLWRHRIYRVRRRARVRNPRPLPRVNRDVQPEVQCADRTQEYLMNADFSNEGNPNLGWKDRFFERSSTNGRHEGHLEAREPSAHRSPDAPAGTMLDAID